MFYSPLLGKILRRFSQETTGQDVAVKSWVVEPARQVERPGAIYLANELDRISGYSAHSTREQELLRIVRHTTWQPQSIVYEFNDAVLCGSLYVGNYKYRIADRREIIKRIPHDIDDAGVLCSTWLGSLYFGHWLSEDTPKKMLSLPYGQHSEVDMPQTEHQRDYNILLGIERRTIPAFAHLKKVTLIDAWIFSDFLAKAWINMTRSIRAHYPGRTHIGCMLLRGASGSKRVLLNEQEIAGRLRSLGFRIIDPARDSLDKILAAASGSRIIVGVEGSQLAHGFHCLEPGGALLVLQPPNRFGCIDKARCDLKDVRYAFSVGHLHTSGFSINIDRLMALLDRVIDDIKPFSNFGLP